MDTIKFITEDGEEIEFYVIEETRLGGMTYLLATESLEDGADAYILKDVSAQTDAEACYVEIEDDSEREAVSKIFAELLDDIDLRS